MADSSVIWVRRAGRAMNTAFEVALWGADSLYQETAAEEALAEVERLDRQLSFFRNDSLIREINVEGAERPIPLDPRIFHLLEQAKQLSEETGGAFDITVAPLLKAWGFSGGSGHLPDEAEVESARSVTGMDLVELDSEALIVRLRKPGVMLDLGAIGKGYAIEQAAGILRDLEVPGGLIHGGTSTAYGLGGQPDGSAWPVAIHNPANPDLPLAVVELRDFALSVSANHGKAFEAGGEQYGHVLDPRTGRPSRGSLVAAVACESATESDALSTALLVRGEEYLTVLENRSGVAAALVAMPDADGALRVESFGTVRVQRVSGQ